jgi:hypothetical protein
MLGTRQRQETSIVGDERGRDKRQGKLGDEAEIRDKQY